MKRLRKWLIRLVRGASTITQQLVKNLYLWPKQSWIRKGPESWFTVWLELSLPKRRILHIYLRKIVQDGIGCAKPRRALRILITEFI